MEKMSLGIILIINSGYYTLFTFAQQNYTNVVVVVCPTSLLKKSECDVTNPAVIIVIRDL